MSYEAGPIFARATGDDAAEKIFDFIRTINSSGKPRTSHFSNVALTNKLANTLDNMVRGADVVLADNLIKYKGIWVRETYTIVHRAMVYTSSV